MYPRHLLSVQNDKGQRPLHTSAERGDTDVVRKYLQLQPGPLPKDHGGRTPLHLSAMWGHSSTLQVLLETNEFASVLERDKRGRMPLHLAAKEGHTQAVKTLLEGDSVLQVLRRDDVHRRVSSTFEEARRRYANTVFQSRFPHRDCLQNIDTERTLLKDKKIKGDHSLLPILLKAKLEVQDLSKDIQNAAVASPPMKVRLDAKYLLSETERALREHTTSGFGFSDSHTSYGLNTAAERLESLVSVDARDNDRRTALNYAADKIEEHWETIVLLVSSGAKFAARDHTIPAEKPQAMAVLESAIKRGDRRIAELLLDQGVDRKEGKDGERGWGHNSLTWAAEYNNIAILRKLVPHEQKLGTADGQRALMCAVRARDQALISAIVKRGADVNGESQGKTALYIAVEGGSPEVVRKLLKSGANTNTEYNGEEVLCTALSKDSWQVAMELLEGGADIKMCIDETPLLLWVLQKYKEIEEWVNDNCRCYDYDDYEPLCDCETQRKQYIKRALELIVDRVGEDVNEADEERHTASTIASELGLSEIASLLIKHDNKLDGHKDGE